MMAAPFSDPRIADALARLPDYLGGHVRVSVAALVLGLAVSLPLALFCLRRPALRHLVLGIASIIQTVPGLALLALFYPLLLALAALCEKLFGAGFSALGFLPSVLALALYSMLPVLRNTLSGLAQIDPAIIEAAQGVGMTRRQSLLMVELPVALPVIMAGIRTASVWVIGTATLSTPVGQTSLGNYIFTGLQTQNWVFVLFGCAAAAILAILVDQLLALAESGVARRKALRIVAAAIGIVLVFGAALAPGATKAPARYVVGAKTFTEQYILASLIQQRLAAQGLGAARREGLGSIVLFNALKAGDVDVYVDYSGTIWANAMGRKDVRPRDDVLTELAQWLEATHGIRLLGGLGFENAYALAMPRARAEALGITSIADLARHAGELTIAGDYEFFGRPEWKAIRDRYGLAFAAQKQMDSTFMYEAAARGDVDVISAFSSDGRIAKYDLVLIADPKQTIPPYDAIVLVAPDRAHDEKLIDALSPLIGKIEVRAMQEANLSVDRTDNKQSPAAAARALWQGIARNGTP